MNLHRKFHLKILYSFEVIDIYVSKTLKISVAHLLFHKYALIETDEYSCQSQLGINELLFSVNYTTAHIM